LLTDSEDGWTVLDGACPTSGSSVFLANGQTYFGWAELQTVMWGPVDLGD